MSCMSCSGKSAVLSCWATWCQPTRSSCNLFSLLSFHWMTEHFGYRLDGRPHLFLCLACAYRPSWESTCRSPTPSARSSWPCCWRYSSESSGANALAHPCRFTTDAVRPSKSRRAVRLHFRWLCVEAWRSPQAAWAITA